MVSGKKATPLNNWSDEETNEPLIADNRNYHKVEKWMKDGSKVDRMLYASSSLDKAREVFDAPPSPAGRWLMQRFIDGAGRADG